MKKQLHLNCDTVIPFWIEDVDEDGTRYLAVGNFVINPSIRKVVVR